MKSDHWNIILSASMKSTPCTVAPRITYYSIRLDNEAMRKKVLERHIYARFFHASQSAQDAALTPLRAASDPGVLLFARVFVAFVLVEPVFPAFYF